MMVYIEPAPITEKTVSLLYDWYKLNRLSINLNKTKHMVVCKDIIESVHFPAQGENEWCWY